MNTYFFSSTRSVALSFSSLLSWLLSAQLGWRLGWGRGDSLYQGHCDMFWLFTYTLIQVLIMFGLSTRKKRAGKSRKTAAIAIEEIKNVPCTQACTHAHRHTPLNSQGRTHHTYTYTPMVEDRFKASQQPSNLAHTPSYWHSDTHTTTTTFISSAAQQVLGCQSINIDSHFDSTYSFIYLHIHILIHFT